MMKYLTRIVVLAAGAFSLMAAAGCGEISVLPEDAGPIEEIDAAIVVTGDCTPETFANDCPVRECEVATGCTAGVCDYGAFVCGQEGSVCPIETCRATLSEDVVNNECIVVQAAPCGTSGGSCVGSECVIPTDGLTLSGSLENASIRDTSGALTLNGELSYSRQDSAPQFTTSSLRLTGGLQN